MYMYQEMPIEVMQFFEKHAKIRRPDGRLDVVPRSDIHVKGQAKDEAAGNVNGDVDDEVEGEKVAEPAQVQAENAPSPPQLNLDTIWRHGHRNRRPPPDFEPPQYHRRGGGW